jgi:phage tail protein X
MVAGSYSCSLANGSAGATVTATLYKVAEGDTMAKISQKMYGTTSRAGDIQAANPWLLGLDNWGLVVGMILTIPA